MNQSILVLDCGATNVRAVLVDGKGSIVSQHSVANNTIKDTFLPGGLLWDVDEIWRKMCQCSRKVTQEAKGKFKVAGITLTTFGVDGAPVTKEGKLLYPVISWQCNRTESIIDKITEFIGADELYQKSGLQSYPFNTLFKLGWLRQNKPKVLDNTHKFLFIPSLFIFRMTGEMLNDTTMAGTSMLTNLKQRDFDEAILKTIGLNKEKFYPMVEPGTIAGHLLGDAARELGLPEKIPVIVGGHDTQFAVFGAGALSNQPVLSSGTWEILMARSDSGKLAIPGRKEGVTIELDSTAGLVNPGVQWVASGVLEWMMNLMCCDINSDASRFDKIISEAEKIDPGCNGVTVIPEFFSGGILNKKGCIEGLTHTTTRAHIYRATLEALSFYLKKGLSKLEKVSASKADSIICVGGGSKNRLWNQIRSDVLGVSVFTNDTKETTVLGVACFAMAALNWYNNPDDALRQVNYQTSEFIPGKNNSIYQDLYNTFCEKHFV
ncbi:MAG TPA: L-fuculokinase [Bacteroidales bacterium]|nr:L-fuculokinase [Bacteroidales bacterium]